MELQAKAGDDQAKAQVQNQKLLESRRPTRPTCWSKGQDMQLNQQKADLARAAHQAKQADMAPRQTERQAAQQFKFSQNGLGLGGR